MKKLALILMAGASLVGTVGAASAQYYYRGIPYGPYYGDGWYPTRGYGPGFYAYREVIHGRDSLGRPEIWFSVGRDGGCPRGYSIRDGVCKLYRGY